MIEVLYQNLRIKAPYSASMVLSEKRFYFSSLSLFFFFFVFSLFPVPSLSSTFIVDGVSVWKTPVVHVGDSVVFRHKYGGDLHIFRNKDAFTVCNLTQATVLTKPNSTSFTWYPSRPGFFYFAFTTNTSLKSCQLSQKLAVHVISASAASPPERAPEPVSGGVVASSPSYPWPLGPREGSEYSPGPSPAEITTVIVPAKGGMPFINSNPAVPLPTGEVDSASINPLPTSANNAHQLLVGMMGVVTLHLGLAVAPSLLL
ncbi:PREDICTED: uncharacterized protein LOC104813720 [Tarenaya hassleriana]|uniref:uncharacterized protein LOC104813720 n=1 Tax=Tarenaya hassleriana TaxID=28532 RepID=UPI00053C6D70|nr:PREDICTED: uncharacterized protein LOC104813720 [Tarenaya hassleriana]